jgi:hypothetical protein
MFHENQVAASTSSGGLLLMVGDDIKVTQQLSNLVYTVYAVIYHKYMICMAEDGIINLESAC